MAESGKAPLFFWNLVPWGAMEVRATHAPFSKSGLSAPVKLEDAMGSAATATVGMKAARARQVRNRRRSR
jgi:hypothetical protein